MKKITVLYLDHSDDFSGGQISLLSLLKLLDKTKFHPIVGLDPHALILKAALLKLGIQTIEFTFKKISWYSLPSWFRFLREIRHVITFYNIDILHANTFKTGFIIAVLKMFIRVPFIFRARLGIEFFGHGFIDKVIYKRADLILANSGYVKKTFEEKYGPNPRVKVIFNPLSFDDVKYKQKSTEKFTFAILGRIESIKRHHDLVEASRILVNKGYDFQVWIIGKPTTLDGGAYAKQIEELVKIRQLVNHIHFKGFIDNPMQLAPSINACVSCTIGEALPRSIFECQYNNIPVLAANSGGNIEIIIDNETGFLYKPGNFQDLALKMEKLLIIPDLELDTVKSKAYKQVLSLFNEANTIRAEEFCYQDLCSL